MKHSRARTTFVYHKLGLPSRREHCFIGWRTHPRLSLFQAVGQGTLGGEATRNTSIVLHHVLSERSVVSLRSYSVSRRCTHQSYKEKGSERVSRISMGGNVSFGRGGLPQASPFPGFQTKKSVSIFKTEAPGAYFQSLRWRRPLLYGFGGQRVPPGGGDVPRPRRAGPGPCRESGSFEWIPGGWSEPCASDKDTNSKAVYTCKNRSAPAEVTPLPLRVSGRPVQLVFFWRARAQNARTVAQLFLCLGGINLELTYGVDACDVTREAMVKAMMNATEKKRLGNEKKEKVKEGKEKTKRGRRKDKRRPATKKERRQTWEERLNYFSSSPACSGRTPVGFPDQGGPWSLGQNRPSKTQYTNIQRRFLSPTPARQVGGTRSSPRLGNLLGYGSPPQEGE